jgi:anti-anti-sigma factor
MTTTGDLLLGTAVDERPGGTIAVEDEGGVAVLRLCGEIDQVAVAAYDRTHAPAGTAPAVIDASAVTFLDCRGLRFLVREGAAARRAGRAPALRRPPRVVRRVLDATGADGLFTITA